MAVENHIKRLREDHAKLKKQIRREQQRPFPDELEIRRLKREKLKLKEEIERLEPKLAQA